MLQTVVINVVALPLLLGIIGSIITSGNYISRDVIRAFLFPFFAFLVILLLDGIPAFPPVRAAHKFPYILLAGSFFFAFFAWRFPRQSAIFVSVTLFIATALPIYWMGSTILMNNTHKATVVSILVLIFVAGVFRHSALSNRQSKPIADVILQTVFAMSLASSLIAIFGGYMGMSMFNGALTALSGGYLLVNYLRYLRGNADAFQLRGIAAIAFSWVAFTGLLVTALLAPKASAPALITAASSVVTASFAYLYAPLALAVPYALRPLLLGGLAAVPALAGIIIAGLQFAG